MVIIYGSCCFGRHIGSLLLHDSAVVYEYLQTGRRIRPSIAFLYSGPTISILSIILTARILGIEMGIARTVGAIGFSVVIGLAMAFIFRKEEKAKQEEQMNIVPPPEKTPDVADVVSLFYVGADSRLCKLGCALCL